MNIFACKTPSQEGQFIPEAMVFQVDGDEVAAFQSDQSEDYEEALSRVQENMNLTGVRNKILFTGKWKNDNKVETVSLTNFIKTEEFGGQGAKKPNLGIQFEKDFLKV